MARARSGFASRFGTARRSRFASFITLAAAVGVTGAILVLVPQVQSLEQSAGLAWLFGLRGPRAAPEEIVLVTIGRKAAETISLPNDPEKFHRCDDMRIGARPATHSSLPQMPARWPRCLHAMLIEKLTLSGARAVAFDLLLRTRPALPGSAGDLHARQDQQLATALAQARRVLIAGKLEPSVNDPADRGGEELIEISPIILDAALGVAPVPVIGHLGRFDEYWVFTEGVSATPSLPALALQAYLLDVYPQFRNMLETLAPEQALLLPVTVDDVRNFGQLQATCLLIRALFSSTPGLAGRMRSALASDAYASLDPTVRTGISRLVALHAGPGKRLLNAFGPAGTLRAYGYDEALAFDEQQSTTAFFNKMVFIGYAETLRPEQVDHFPTVFSSGDGVALSGVEITATAFADLLHDSSVRRAQQPLWILIAALAGLISALLVLYLRYRLAFPLVGILLAGYAWAALGLFIERNLWLPLIAPVCIAAPLGLATALTWKYRIAYLQREYIRNAFAKFVPRDVVDKLESNAGDLSAARESIECACVATDAANFTTLAEAMPSEKLADYLNRYFDTLFRPVARHGGFVSDIVGDAMLAIWPHRSPDTREQMLGALLEMREAARLFSEPPATGGLKTRFGVDWGRVTLTVVGSQTHYEYRAIGATANTATRIQELNKKLGTRVLLSAPAFEGVGHFLMRDVGHFLLRGMALPVHVFELIGPRQSADPRDLERCERSMLALALLRKGESAAALQAFRDLASNFSDDGPAAFYVRTLESGVTLRNGALKVE